MKRIIFIWSILFVLLGCNHQEQNVYVDLKDLSDNEHTIIIMHPTVRSLETFRYLTGNSIFPIPENYRVVGAYHKNGIYNYSQTEKYIKEEGLHGYKLFEFSDTLYPGNLYQINESTAKFRALFKNSLGIIFFGGPDLPPATYGEPTSLLTVISDVHRHYLELSMLFHLLGGYQDALFEPLLNQNPNYSILGICLGMQTMNVATGGTMIQDIPTEFSWALTVEEVLDMDPNQQHRNYHSNFGTDKNLIWGHFHQVKYEKGSLFDSLNEFSTQFPYVWSSHHQALKDLGKGIVPIAWSMDGKIIEAVKHEIFPNVIGVQFHPEVPAIFKEDEGLNQIPFQQENKSYIDMYSGEKGEKFHRNLWRYLSLN